MMTGKKAKTILIACMLCGLPFAAAAAGVTPHASVSLKSDVLTVGDIFDGAGDAAGKYLAPAPVFGQTMTLTQSDLTRISNAFNLGWQNDGNISQVLVRRDGHKFDRYEIQAALDEKLAEKMGDHKFELDFDGRGADFVVPSDTKGALEVRSLKYDLNKSSFNAVVGLSGTGIEKNISGKLYTLTEVPVLKKSFSPGDVIGAEDIQYIDMKTDDLSASMVVSPEALIGQTPRRSLSPLKPVMQSEVTAPCAVKKGELVTMTLDSGVISLTAEGRAMGNASVGEVVRVINTSSNQAVDAVVTGPQTVAVRQNFDKI